MLSRKLGLILKKLHLDFRSSSTSRRHAFSKMIFRAYSRVRNGQGPGKRERVENSIIMINAGSGIKEVSRDFALSQ